jgi:hypothetical protein
MQELQVERRESLQGLQGVVRFSVVVETHGAGVWRRRATATWGEDELCGFVFRAGEEEHVAGGAVEELTEDLRGDGGSIAAEDAFFGNAAGDGNASELGDLMEDLVEAGVLCRDRELVVEVGDPGAIRGSLSWRSGLRRWLCRGGRGRGDRCPGMLRNNDRRRGLCVDGDHEAEQQGES